MLSSNWLLTDQQEKNSFLVGADFEHPRRFEYLLEAYHASEILELALSLASDAEAIFPNLLVCSPLRSLIRLAF